MAACASNSDSFAKIVECPVCCELLKQPKQLACGHSICGNCSRKIQWTPVSVGSRILCPVCREGTVVPWGKKLATNFPLANMTELVEAQKNTPTHKCSNCGEENEASRSFVCGDCPEFACLCALCVVNHQHKVETLEKHMKTQTVRFQQWMKGTMEPSLECLKRQMSGTRAIDVQRACDRCSNLLDQIRASSQEQATVTTEAAWVFEDKLTELRGNENSLNADNGYTFDLTALEHQFEVISEGYRKAKMEQCEALETLRGLETTLTHVASNERTTVSAAHSGNTSRNPPLQPIDNYTSVASVTLSSDLRRRNTTVNNTPYHGRPRPCFS